MSAVCLLVYSMLPVGFHHRVLVYGMKTYAQMVDMFVHSRHSVYSESNGGWKHTIYMN